MNDELVPLIQWHDGMALSPHHFQQKERRDQQLLSWYSSHLSPYCYGIQGLVIDSVSLPLGQFKILKVDITMSDGTVYGYDIEKTNSSDVQLSLQCDLNEHRELLAEKEGTIFLLLPSLASRVSPVHGALPRYTSVEGTPVKDENTDENPLSIARLIPNFSLVLTDTLPVKYTGFPIAKVKFQDSSFHLIDFVPPCFHIDSQSSLMLKSREMLQKLREKTQAFSEKWQNQIGSNLLKETADILKPLLTILPPLEVLVTSPFVSPKNLYDELIRSVGILSQLNLARTPEKFPCYNHNDIKACITPLLDFIFEHIDHVSLEYAIFPFLKNNRIFSFKLTAAYGLKDEILVGLKARPGTHPQKIEDWMSNAVIVSDNAIQSVKEKRVLGAPRSILNDNRLYEMSPPRDMSIFSITLDKVFVQVNQYLHIFNQSDQESDRPLDIVLYVPKFQNEQPVNEQRAA